MGGGGQECLKCLISVCWSTHLSLVELKQRHCSSIIFLQNAEILCGPLCPYQGNWEKQRKGQTDLEPSVYQYIVFSNPLDDRALSPLVPIPCHVCCPAWQTKVILLPFKLQLFICHNFCWDIFFTTIFCINTDVEKGKKTWNYLKSSQLSYG